MVHFTHLNILQSRGLTLFYLLDWRSDIKPKVHVPALSRPSVPGRLLCNQTRPGESERSQRSIKLESSSPIPSAQLAGAPILHRDTTLSVLSEPTLSFWLKGSRPEIYLGLSDRALAVALHSAGITNVDFLLNDLQDTSELISDPGVTPLSLRYPFLLVEAKSGATGGNLYQAQNQAAVGGASGWVFWDESGNWKNLIPIPDRTFEKLAVNIQGEDVEGLLGWLRRALQGDPADRPTALELLMDPWLMKGLKLRKKPEDKAHDE